MGDNCARPALCTFRLRFEHVSATFPDTTLLFNMFINLFSIILPLVLKPYLYIHPSPFQEYVFIIGSVGLGRQALAIQEANLTCDDISYYGAAAMKIPQSFVTQCSALYALHQNKSYKFNFQGSAFRDSALKRRAWV